MLAKRSRATVPCAAAYSQSGASFAASRYALAAMIPYLTTSISLAAKPKTESGAVGALRGLRAPRPIPEAALCDPCAAAPRITIRFNAASCQDKNRTPPRYRETASRGVREADQALDPPPPRIQPIRLGRPWLKAAHASRGRPHWMVAWATQVRRIAPVRSMQRPAP